MIDSNTAWSIVTILIGAGTIAAVSYLCRDPDPGDGGIAMVGVAVGLFYVGLGVWGLIA